MYVYIFAINCILIIKVLIKCNSALLDLSFFFH